MLSNNFSQPVIDTYGAGDGHAVGFLFFVWVLNVEDAALSGHITPRHGGRDYMKKVVRYYHGPG